MIRLVALAIGLLAIAPAANATRQDTTCAVNATRVTGAAPLTVTYTASCTSAAYAWDFGDGSQAVGPTVTHTFAGGRFSPSLTTGGGVTPLHAVTSIAITVSGPKQVDYGAWVVLHITVTPDLPAAVRGHRVVDGTVRLRGLSTAPYVAIAANIRSASLKVLLTPRIVARIAGVPVVGGKLRVVASLHPAHAGTLHVRVDGRAATSVATSSAHTAAVLVAADPAAGWAAPKPVTLHASVVQPNLSVGATGASVVELERRLAALHYLVPHDPTFSSELTDGIYAFQKVQGIARTGIADAATWSALQHPRAPTPRFRGSGVHIEVSKPLQVLLVVRDGGVTQISPVSTAGLPGKFTPVGSFQVYRKVDGFDPSPLGTLWKPSYFTGGYAIHGNPSVPPYPASHGCIRVPMWIAPILFDEMPLGTPVDVY